jgi:ABC-type multidrug transport system fused ATPase/permease subunit
MIVFLIPIIVSAVLGLVGLFANWWFNFLEWNIVIVGIIVLAACVIATFIGSWWMRLVIIVALAIVMYIHGALDQRAYLTVRHKAEVQQIHKRYSDAATAERQRQLTANEKAQLEAAAEKEKQDADLASLRDQLTLLRSQAATDTHASELAINADAVRRINAFRLWGVPTQ